MMIDVKQAARLASDYIVGLYADQTISAVQLEEVELSEDRKYWLITLSFAGPSIPGLSFLAGNRHYKVVKVDAGTGEVVSMKIRELSHATS